MKDLYGIRLTEFNGKYPQCIFCYGKGDVFEMTGRGSLVVSICKCCLYSLYNQANEYDEKPTPTELEDQFELETGESCIDATRSSIYSLEYTEWLVARSK